MTQRLSNIINIKAQKDIKKRYNEVLNLVRELFSKISRKKKLYLLFLML